MSCFWQRVAPGSVEPAGRKRLTKPERWREDSRPYFTSTTYESQDKKVEDLYILKEYAIE